MSVKAVLLAAGAGTRLRPLTDVLPKCLAPVRGRPLLEHWLRLLFEGPVSRALVNTHHHAPLVAAYLSGSPWAERVEVAHEPALLGTGGTLLAHARFLEGGTFLVAHADNLTSFDVGAFLAAHRARPAGALMTMMTFTTPDPRSCGIVSVDARGVVCGFQEKPRDPPGDRANAAVYLFEPEVLALMAAAGEPCVDLSTQVLPRLVGRMAAWHNATYHRDIGTPESLAAGNREFPGGTMAPPTPDPWPAVLARLTAAERAVLARSLADDQSSTIRP